MKIWHGQIVLEEDDACSGCEKYPIECDLAQYHTKLEGVSRRRDLEDSDWFIIKILKCPLRRSK